MTDLYPCDRQTLKALLHSKGVNFGIVCRGMYRSHNYIGQQLTEKQGLNPETMMFLRDKYGITPDQYATEIQIPAVQPSKRVHVTGVDPEVVEMLATMIANAIRKREGHEV